MEFCAHEVYQSGEIIEGEFGIHCAIGSDGL